MKQAEFKELLFMARNEFAMPKEEAVKREYAVNQARLLQRGAKRVTGHDRDLLMKRQEELLREMSRC